MCEPEAQEAASLNMCPTCSIDPSSLHIHGASVIANAFSTLSLLVGEKEHTKYAKYAKTSKIKAALQLSWTWPVVQLEERQHQVFPKNWQATSSSS